VKRVTFLIALALATSGYRSQPSGDAQQLAAALREEFGVPVVVQDGYSDNLYIYVSVPLVDTLKYTTQDREHYSERVAQFARHHSRLGSGARYIHVQLTMRQDDGVQRGAKSLGSWTWEKHSLDDSSAAPDLLKGSQPK
jgi:hypothetical protein